MVQTEYDIEPDLISHWLYRQFLLVWHICIYIYTQTCTHVHTHLDLLIYIYCVRIAFVFLMHLDR